MTRLRPLILAAFLLFCGNALAEEAADGLVFRIFDVQTLVAPANHFNKPPTLLTERKSGDEGPLVPIPWAEGDENAFLSADDLLTLINTNLFDEEGLEEAEPEGAFTWYANGRLYVRNTPDAVGRIASLLKVLSGKALQTIVMDVHILVPSGTPDGQDGLTRMTDEQAEKALEKARRHGRLLRSYRVSALNGQRAVILQGTEESYVSDFDSEVAQSAYIANPIMAVLQTGFFLSLKPSLSVLDNGVVLTFDFTAVSSEKETGPFEDKTTSAGQLQIPSIRFSSLKTSAAVNRNEWLSVFVPSTPAGTDGAPAVPSGFQLVIRPVPTPPPLPGKEHKK